MFEEKEINANVNMMNESSCKCAKPNIDMIMAVTYVPIKLYIVYPIIELSHSVNNKKVNVNILLDNCSGINLITRQRVKYLALEIKQNE